MMAEVRVKKLDIPDRFGETDCLAWRSQNVTAANGDMLEVLIHVHRRVQIPEAEWKIFRMRLLQKLGHI